MIKQIMPVTIYHGSVANVDAVQAEVQAAVDDVTFDYNPEWGMTHKISNLNDGWGSCVIKKYKMQTLWEEIMKGCDQLVSMMPSKVFITSWLTRYDYRDFAHVHNHVPSTVSGCYYFSVDSLSTSHIFFKSKETSDASRVVCKDGDLVLFPSQLDHGVFPNETDEPRITLAFNLTFAD